MKRTAARQAAVVLAVTCAAVLVTGCGLLEGDPETEAPTGGPPLMSQKTYAIGTGSPDESGIRAVIPFQYTNETDRPVYFPGCFPPGPPLLERRAADGT